MKYNKRITLGYKPDGRQIQKWFHANSKADLEEQIFRFRMEQEKALNPSEISFGEYSERWMKTYKCNCSKQTRDMYANAEKKCDRLDPFEIRKITRSMCQDIINELWDTPRTAQITAAYLKQLFKAAAQDGIMALNPADGLRLPRPHKQDKYLLNDKEMEAARNAKMNPSDRMFLDILIIFGLRPGEALALQPRNFDLKNKMLRIDKALEMPNSGEPRIKSTKTGNCRDIPIPEGFISRLRAYFRANPGFYLFTRKDGGLYTKSAYRRLSERILKAINNKLWEKKDPDGKIKFRVNLIPEVTLYSFRHRRATDLYYLAQKGIISTKKAAELMGHSEEVFLRTYSHVDNEKENVRKIYDEMVI